jgi:hypothetical protein
LPNPEPGVITAERVLRETGVLDHLIVPGEAHLRQILKIDAAYYNEVRTHLSLARTRPTSGAPRASAGFSRDRSWVAFTIIRSGLSFDYGHRLTGGWLVEKLAAARQLYQAVCVFTNFRLSETHPNL